MEAPLKVYKASAGTGKTFTLAVQYIANIIAVADGLEYRHILAVTFTNKATAEMKDRILEQLYGLWKGLKSSDDYLDKIRMELAERGLTLTAEEIRKRAGTALHNILHDFSRFRVETIDSFFQSVLKNLAHELNLTANMRVELNDMEVLSEAVDRIMDRLHLTPRILAWILEYVNERIENDKHWNISSEIKHFGKAIFHKAYLTHQESLKDISEPAEKLRRILQEERARVNDQVRSAAEHFQEQMEERGLAYEAFSNGKILYSYISKLRVGDPTAEAKETLKKFMASPENMVRKPDRKDAALMDHAVFFSALLSEVYNFHQEQTAIESSASLTLKYLNPLRLLSVIDQEVTAVSEENGNFLLSKTPILLNELTEDSDAPFIFEKTGTLLHHIMIDEFQDTSTLQWRNFKTLLKETMASGNSNLIVGDTKQSIYRWRNGDWTILQHILKEFPNYPVQIASLHTNYRSERRVITFNNHFFEKAASILDGVGTKVPDDIQDLYVEKDEDGGTQYQLSNKTDENGLVDVRIYTSKDTAWEDDMLQELCERVKLLRNKGAEWKDMAIILRTKNHVEAIMDAFAHDDELKEVNLISDEAFSLESSISIQLIISALRYLDDPSDTISQAFLATHAPGNEKNAVIGQLNKKNLSEHMPAFLADERARLCNMPLYELQEELYRRLQLERIAGQDMYITAYLDAVSEYLKDAPSSIHMFLKTWDENLHSRHTPANPVNGIRVVTIHLSKGLEYPTVFVPYCDWEIENDRYDNTLWCEPKEAPYNLLPVIPISEQTSMAKSCFSDEYEEEHLKKRIDALNLIYVAFTRPKSNLFVWAKSKKGNTGRSSTIGNLIADALPTDIEGATIEWNEDNTPSHFTYGTVHIKKKSDEKNDNRMKLEYEDIHLTVKARQPDITFCQSYQAEEFMQVVSTTDQDGRHETDRRLMGIALHKGLSSIRDKDDIEKVLLQLETEGYISTLKEKEMLIERIEQALNDPEVEEWFDGSMELYNECPIISKEYNAQKSKYESYRPDRVMMDKERIIVVDFKTGSAQCKSAMKAHKEQVKNYMKQLQLMEPAKETSGFLWYIIENHKEAIHI